MWTERYHISHVSPYKWNDKIIENNENINAKSDEVYWGQIENLTSCSDHMEIGNSHLRLDSPAGCQMVTHPGTNHEQRCFFGDPLGTGTFNVLGIAAGGYD